MAKIELQSQVRFVGGGRFNGDQHLGQKVLKVGDTGIVHAIPGEKGELGCTFGGGLKVSLNYLDVEHVGASKSHFVPPIRQAQTNVVLSSPGKSLKASSRRSLSPARNISETRTSEAQSPGSLTRIGSPRTCRPERQTGGHTAVTSTLPTNGKVGIRGGIKSRLSTETLKPIRGSPNQASSVATTPNVSSVGIRHAESPMSPPKTSQPSTSANTPRTAVRSAQIVSKQYAPLSRNLSPQARPRTSNAASRNNSPSLSSSVGQPRGSRVPAVPTARVVRPQPKALTPRDLAQTQSKRSSPTRVDAAAAIEGPSAATGDLTQRQTDRGQPVAAASVEDSIRQIVSNLSPRPDVAAVMDEPNVIHRPGLINDPNATNGPLLTGHGNVVSWVMLEKHPMVQQIEVEYVNASLEAVDTAITSAGGITRYVEKAYQNPYFLHCQEELSIAQVVQRGLEEIMQEAARNGGESILVLLDKVTTQGTKKSIRLEMTIAELHTYACVLWDWDIRLEASFD